ncbi:MAG: hypothetical protein NZ534_06180, partial [Bacteroidia bacterium]|nr:hypothetical protein [Bacteroidia bacterium]
YYPLKDSEGKIFGAAVHARTARERAADERRRRVLAAMVNAAFAAPHKAAVLLDSNFNVEYAGDSARSLLGAKSKEQDQELFGLENLVVQAEEWGELVRTLKKDGRARIRATTVAGPCQLHVDAAPSGGYLAVFEF